jgi:hypothetical protein
MIRISTKVGLPYGIHRAELYTEAISGIHAEKIRTHRHSIYSISLSMPSIFYPV